MTRAEIVTALKEFGMSPQKAMEIAMDVERGDDFATRWLASALSTMTKPRCTQELSSPRRDGAPT